MTSTYTSAGITVDRYADIVSRLETLAKERWGESFDTSEDTFFGGLIRDFAIIIGESNELLQSVYDGGSVANSTGSQLDNNTELVGITRSAAAYSTVTLTLTATAATTVPAGSRYSTAAGVVFETDTALVFTGAGSSTVAATCTVTGPYDAAAAEVTTIVTSIYGISAVTNVAAAIPGRNRQTDAELKTTHTTAVATSGDDDASSIYEAVAAVTGVSAVYVFDNDTQEAVGSVPANTIRVSVIGGTDADVAAAINNNKTAGVPTYGATSVAVYNSTTKQSKTIYIDRAVATGIHISFTISTTSGVFPNDGEAQLKAALVAQIGDLTIDDDVIYNSLYSSIYAVSGITAVTNLKLDTVDPPTGTSDLTGSPLKRYTLATADIDITVT